jgi:hypothetical protein
VGGVPDSCFPRPEAVHCFVTRVSHRWSCTTIAATKCDILSKWFGMSPTVNWVEWTWLKFVRLRQSFLQFGHLVYLSSCTSWCCRFNLVWEINLLKHPTITCHGGNPTEVIDIMPWSIVQPLVLLALTSRPTHTVSRDRRVTGLFWYLLCRNGEGQSKHGAQELAPVCGRNTKAAKKSPVWVDEGNSGEHNATVALIKNIHLG